MVLPFSDIPEDAVQQHILQTLHALGDLERILTDFGGSQASMALCQSAQTLLSAIKAQTDNNKPETMRSLNSTIRYLTEIRDSLE